MPPAPDAAVVVGLLRSAGETVATAESVTGGLVCASLTDVPGASAVVVGGVVAYTHRAKADLLGVSADALAAQGAVNASTAVAMADGARERLACDWAVATTGVAGPDPSDGEPVGTVYLAASGRRSTWRRLNLAGDREDIRRQTCQAALHLLIEVLE